MDNLHQDLARLSERQLSRIENIVSSLLRGTQIEKNPDSDFADDNFVKSFGDLLLLHNQGSSIPLTKDKFEYAMVDALRDSGHSARKLPNGNPGEDIVVNGSPWSLKTQADKNIKKEFIHISKFMELGKGKWDTADDIAELRNGMFRHMESYDRIFTLRCAPRVKGSHGGEQYSYELVEIPKELLKRSAKSSIEIMENSKQNPKPAYVRVYDEDNREVFSLYFDGGTERKLQVKKLSKKYCIIHATWRFEITP